MLIIDIFLRRSWIVASLVYLFKNNYKADALGEASAEIGVFFGVLTMVLGAICVLAYTDALARIGIGEIAAGFGSLKDQVWRIGLMGDSSRKENITLLLAAFRELIS